VLVGRAIRAAASRSRVGHRVTDPNLGPEPTDHLGASPEFHDDPSRGFVRQEQERVDPDPVGPTARFQPQSRDPAARDPEFPTVYRAARWAAVALISATTMLTAWWLVHAGVISCSPAYPGPT
jgi:hypothetical protein